MFKNDLKLSVRNFIKDKLFSLIKVISLTIGLTCFIIIYLFVRDELSYDKFHLKKENIYRVGYDIRSETSDPVELAWVSYLVGPKLLEDYGEIEKVVHLRANGGVMSVGEKSFRETKGFFAGEDFFEIFSFNLKSGDPSEVLKDPYTIVLTEDFAGKYFEDENPVGKNMRFITGDTLDLIVTGVVENVPSNSHFSFDFLISHKTREIIYPHIQGWFALGTHTYILTRTGVNKDQLQEKIRNMVMKYYGEEAREIGYELYLFLQPLSEIHLHSKLRNEIETNSDIQYVYIFSVIAVFVLLIALFNFINLSTAQSLKYAKAIGVRKMLGSTKLQVIRQLLIESMVLTLIAAIVALGLIELALPYFNNLTGKELNSPFLKGLEFWLFVIGILLFVSITGGLIPAYRFSKYKPVEVLRGKADLIKGFSLRKLLVIIQFFTSVLLITGTLVVYNQLDFMINKPLGFQKEQVMVIQTWMNRDPDFQYETLKTEFLKVPGVKDVTASNSVPGGGLLNRTSRPQGFENLVVMPSLLVGYNFLDFYKMEIIEGRNFDPDNINDEEVAFIINEKSLEEFGWVEKEAIGKTFEWGANKAGRIIGIVKDFHFNSLQEEIPPIVMHISPGALREISVKLEIHNIKETVQALEKKYDELYRDQVFEYFFLDEQFNSQYESEKRVGEIITNFTILGIFIAVLGLIGLVASVVQKKIKEIGIRKVMGAGVLTIVWMLTKDFTKLVLISIIIAIPLSYLFLEKWLENFAYRIEIEPWTYVLTGIVVLLIAWLTLSYQSFKAALMNPVDTLRDE